MEAFIRTKLQPTERCIICSDHFSEEHLPVALPCHHIFGHECINKWLRDGRGNTNSCPCCRHEIYTPMASPPFTDASIWTALCEQSPEHIHNFMTTLWHRMQQLFTDQPTSEFTVHSLLERAVIPALSHIARAHNDRGAFQDSYSVVLSTWNSLGRPNTAHGLAIPLVRLARLMAQTSSILPKWITTVPRMSQLFWRANASLGTASLDITWAHLAEAALLTNDRYFQLLHLYTVLLSQNIVHSPSTHEGLMRNLVVERCCHKIGGEWGGRPSEGFRESVVSVYEELRRHQLDEKRISLRGHEEEKAVVAGLWAMVMWKREDVGRGRPTVDGVGLRKKASGGWSD